MGSEIHGDDALQAELLKFNAFLEMEAQQQRAERETKQLARRREEAATALKKLRDDPGASQDAKASAEAEWKAAVEAEKAGPSGADGGNSTGSDATPPVDEERSDGETPAEDAAGSDAKPPVDEERSDGETPQNGSVESAEASATPHAAG